MEKELAVLQHLILSLLPPWTVPALVSVHDQGFYVVCWDMKKTQPSMVYFFPFATVS